MRSVFPCVLLATLLLLAASCARQGAALVASPDPAPPAPPAFAAAASADEFIGPLAGWADARKDYGAEGNGQADDTAALQRAFDNLGDGRKHAVLYLPAGTYRITDTLVMKTRLGVSILGEDPAATKILWDGPPDGAMAWFNGVAFSRWGRTTWDGGGKAQVAVDHGWEGQDPHAATHLEHADEVFQNVGYGIIAGRPHFQDAEAAVLRCRFLRCSQAGLAIRSFNALDWFVWYSLFEDCNVGVTNTPGAGNYHVYNSVFRRSRTADVAMGNLSFFALRGNYSSGSRCFFSASQLGSGALCTVQGNTIVNTTDPAAIQYHNMGPLLLLDNTFVSQAAGAGPVVDLSNGVPQGADLVAVGNTFTVDNPIVCHGRLREVDTRVTAVAIPPEPVLPPTAPNRHRRIIEVPAGGDGAALQAALAEAAQYRGTRPVLHLPAGRYEMAQTLVVPAGLDVQIVGDGYLGTTQLVWTGGEGGPVVRLEGPTRATLRDLHLNGGGRVEGLVVTGCDKPAGQPGGRVFSEQLATEGGLGVGLLVDGLDHCNVEMRDFYHNGATDCSVRVLGGPLRAAGHPAGGRVALFGGASGNNALTYEVRRGGYLIARDTWYEANAATGSPRFVQLSDRGTFTFHTGIAAVPPRPEAPAVLLDDFRGRVSLLNLELGSVGQGSATIKVTGPGQDTRVLVLGAVSRLGDPYFFNESPRAQAALVSSRRSTDRGTEPIDNQGPQDDAFLREMLAQTRKEQPLPLTDLAADLPDARLYRVYVSQCTVGVHLLP